MMSSGDESDSPEGAVARETFANTDSNPPASIEAVRINEVLSGKFTTKLASRGGGTIQIPALAIVHRTSYGLGN
jgi:hypothetical protein